MNTQLSSLLQTYKKSPGLQSSFNTNPEKLTADNINAIISALFEIDDENNVLQDSINANTAAITNANAASQTRDKNLSSWVLQQLAKINSKFSGDKDSCAYASQAGHANTADKAASADYAQQAKHAISADYAIEAGKTTNTLSIYSTDDINEVPVTFNGSENVAIKSIVSSLLTSSAIQALSSVESVSSLISDHALSADIAGRVPQSLILINSDQAEQQYDGSDTIIFSSVLSSMISNISLSSTESLCAYLDLDNNELNTMVWYTSNGENADYPILFSQNDNNNVEFYTKKYVSLNEQITINPYLASIKANYFIGTATSATYAVCDSQKNIINTRVCQNVTNNNLSYPFLLSYINSEEQPSDGNNNEVFYTSTMRINPYINTIFANGGVFDSSTDPDYYIAYKGQEIEDHKNDIIIFSDGTVSEEYGMQELSALYGKISNINFVGLATRAIADVRGKPLNTQVEQLHFNSDDDIRPLIFQSKSYEEKLADPIHCPSGVSSTISATVYYNNEIYINSSSKRLCSPNLSSVNLYVTNIKSESLQQQKITFDCLSTTFSGNIYCESVYANDQISAKSKLISPSVSGNTLIIDTISPLNQLITLNSNTQIVGNTTFDKDITIAGTLNAPYAKLATIDTSNTNGQLDIRCSTVKFAALNSSTDVSIENGHIIATGTITAPYFDGLAASANWADLAEIYETDMQYPIGTLVQFGGQKELTIATTEVNAVISQNPAYLMNSNGVGQAIALVGRVRVLIDGKAQKFNYLTKSEKPGLAKAVKEKPNNYIGRVLENKLTTQPGLALCVIQLSL